MYVAGIKVPIGLVTEVDKLAVEILTYEVLYSSQISNATFIRKVRVMIMFKLTAYTEVAACNASWDTLRAIGDSFCFIQGLDAFTVRTQQ